MSYVVVILEIVMKKFIVAAAFGVIAISSAHAEVTKLKLSFGGGCTSSNKGNCVLEVTAEGTDLETESVRLYSGASKDSLKQVSSKSRTLTSEGRASYRVRNTPGGCYQVRTAPNGNGVSDHKSRVICEK